MLAVEMVNVILEKVSPWHKVRLTDVGWDGVDDSVSLIALEIGGVSCCVIDGKDEIKVDYPKPSEQDRAFIARWNAVLKGATRDENGNIKVPA